MEMVKELFATTGDSLGEIDLQWDAVSSARQYVIQLSSAGSRSHHWRYVDIVNGSHYTISGLKPEKLYAFRIAVIGKEGQGPWSRPVVKKAG